MFNAFHSFLGEVQTKMAANVQFIPSNQAPVVQTSDSAIHRINHYPADSVLISGILIRWIAIYPVDSAIQRLNNRGL